MTVPVTVLQHLPHEGPGLVADVLAARGHATRVVRLWEEPCPSDPRAVGALVVLGGDMCTDEKDTYPHLADEVALLARCVEAGTPTLGICLGGQLLAEATGGSVAHGVPEIGYPPIHRTESGRRDPVLAALPEGAPAFNAHRDYITAPADAVHLAYSDAAPVHGFRLGRAYGIQFHPEFTAAMVERYVAAPGVPDYLRGAGWEPDALVGLARRHDADHRRAHSRLVEAWLGWAEETAGGGPVASTG